MDPMKAQQLAAELEVEMMADMYNRLQETPLVGQPVEFIPPSGSQVREESGRFSAMRLQEWGGRVRLYWKLKGLEHDKRLSQKMRPPHYKEAELSKGEAVCLDRCVAKYLDLHERLGRKLTELSVQDEEMMRKAATGTG